MASRKSYAYQIKGNKISLIENQFGWGSGQDVITVDGSSISHKQHTLDEIGPTGKPSWVSPTDNVLEGIELEFTYAPTYRLNHPGGITPGGGVDRWKFVGYGSDGTNLVLFCHDDSNDNLFNLQADFAEGDKIFIDGGIFHGIHTVKTRATQSWMVMETPYNPGSRWVSNLGVAGTYAASNKSFTGTAGNENGEVENFKIINNRRTSGVYVHIHNTNDVENSGFFEVDCSSTTEGELIFLNRILVDLSTGGISTTPAVLVDESADSITLMQAYYNPFDLFEGVTGMDDETFELDITPMQARAVEAYLMAKKAESAANMDMFNFYSTEFRKLIERNENSKVSGPRKIMGFGMTR